MNANVWHVRRIHYSRIDTFIRLFHLRTTSAVYFFEFDIFVVSFFLNIRKFKIRSRFFTTENPLLLDGNQAMMRELPS